MDAGIVPKPPAQTLAPLQPTPAEVEAKREQDRLAEIGRQKEQAELILRSEQTNPSRNGYEAPPSLLDGAKKTMDKIAESRAKAESETMRVYNANGQSITREVKNYKRFSPTTRNQDRFYGAKLGRYARSPQEMPSSSEE